MDVSARLRGLGLEHYGPAFRDNDIDAEILAERMGVSRCIKPAREQTQRHVCE